MKFRIALTIGVIACLCVTETSAQSYTEEALMVSRTNVGGTARIQSMGGVQVALGGDLSLAYSNPAGLGMYNRSEFAASPGMIFANYASDYLGNTTNASQSTPIISNFGVAFHADQDGSKGLWGGTLGITFNRINNFNETFSYSGTNPTTSLIDYFVLDADRYGNVSQFAQGNYQYNRPTGLAYYSYLISPQSSLVPPGPADQYFTPITGIPRQSETVKNSGAQNQWSISYGLNFNDKVYIGAGLGIVTLKYASDRQYKEEFTEAGHYMSPMTLHENISLSGTGINFTAGAIFRPITSVQMGLSISTPTAMEIEDNYIASMTTAWDSTAYSNGNTSIQVSTDNVASSYSISTPWKISGGLTYFFGKHGFISTDVEWLNYAKARYSGGDWSVDNNIINDTYQSTFNLRFGGEYRVNNLRFRAGYNYMPDPYRTGQGDVDRSFSSISGGAGYRTAKFYVDLALIYGSGNNSYRPYQLNDPPTSIDPLVKQSQKNTTVMITVGLPF